MLIPDHNEGTNFISAGKNTVSVKPSNVKVNQERLFISALNLFSDYNFPVSKIQVAQYLVKILLFLSVAAVKLSDLEGYIISYLFENNMNDPVNCYEYEYFILNFMRWIKTESKKNYSDENVKEALDNLVKLGSVSAEGKVILKEYVWYRKY